MSRISRAGRCACGRPADRGTHDRCHARMLLAERFGPRSELERERFRRPYRRGGAR